MINWISFPKNVRPPKNFLEIVDVFEKPFTVKGKLSLWTCEHEIEYLKKPKNEKEDEAFGRRCWNPIIYNV